MPLHCGTRLAISILLGLVGSAAWTASTFEYDIPLQPEGVSAPVAQIGRATRTYAVAAANPLAADAGLQVLRAGGSAIDAAIAVQMVLTLVEPQSSGIGGGAFLVHFDGNKVQAFDGRETAPAGAGPTLFLDVEGKPISFVQAVVGGRAVGVPGVLPMLAMAHRQHGKLSWQKLFLPAITLADQGFPISQRMATLLANEKHLSKDAAAAAYFYDENGNPWPAGHLLRNPELAAVLRHVASQGVDAFMHGEIAQAIVNKVRHHSSNPGTLSLQDLGEYRALERDPLCFDHLVKEQGKGYRICGMPPPSSGSTTLGQILGLLQYTPASTLSMLQGLPSSDWLHLYTEASRLAFADRAKFVADPAFVPIPLGNWNSLLEPRYLQNRAKTIETGPLGKSMKTTLPGNPGGANLALASSPDQPEYGTSHISIFDKYGNALAMTTSIEDGFGSRLLVNRGGGLKGGFLLNNQLTDFSFIPSGADGLPIANRVEAGKRPRSSMSPTLVFDKVSGQAVISAGSPGGPLIIHFTAKTLYAMLHWGLNAQQAIDLPNFGSLNGPTLLEEGRFQPGVIQALIARGHEVMEVPMPSGLQTIQRTTSGYFGGADPRREGIVLGD